MSAEIIHHPDAIWQLCEAVARQRGSTAAAVLVEQLEALVDENGIESFAGDDEEI